MFDIPFCVGYNTENASCKEGAEFSVLITKIEATQKDIVIHTDFEDRVTVRETVATVGPNVPRVISETDVFASDGVIVMMPIAP